MSVTKAEDSFKLLIGDSVDGLSLLDITDRIKTKTVKGVSVDRRKLTLTKIFCSFDDLNAKQL